MKIIVIRHGESVADILKVNEGRADFELTKKGEKQASKMSKYILDNFKVSKIYSSTLKRAKKTAEILSEKIKTSAVYLDNLKEFDNGKLAGLSYEVADILYPKVDDLPFDQSVYGMESQKEFRLRAKQILNDIIRNTKRLENIVIISHGGMINKLYESFMELEIDVKVDYPTGDTGIHVWELDKGERTIIMSNYLEHLK